MSWSGIRPKEILNRKIAGINPDLSLKGRVFLCLIYEYILINQFKGLKVSMVLKVVESCKRSVENVHCREKIG